MAALSELLDYIFDGKKTAFYREFETWLRDSRRFKEFAIYYRGKIRTKLKNVRDESQLQDLRAELATALCLLQEKSFTLEYEKYAALKQRGADFTVTFKTHTPFNLEVRRIRSLETEKDDDAQLGKLMTVLCDKLGQMQASIINFLWLIDERQLSEIDLNHAMNTLLQLAAQKDEAYFTRRGFTGSSNFLKHQRHLTGIILHQAGANLLWLNPLARHKAPADIQNALQRLKYSPTKE